MQERLLALNRDHWQVANASHERHDAGRGGDASRFPKDHASANNVTLNRIVLAVVFRGGFC